MASAYSGHNTDNISLAYAGDQIDKLYSSQGWSRSKECMCIGLSNRWYWPSRARTPSLTAQ